MPKALAGVVLVLGCSGPSDPKTVSGSAPPPAPIDCSGRSAALGKRLQELSARNPGFLPMHQGIRAPVSTAGKALTERGTVVAITADGKAVIQGEIYNDAGAVFEYLDSVYKKAREAIAMSGGDSNDTKLYPLYLWVDRDAPSNKVADVIDASAKAGSWSVRFLVAGPAPAAIKPASSVAATAAKLPATEPDGTKYLADQIRAAMGECRPLIMSLGTNAIIGLPDKQAAALVADLPKGLLECECKLPGVDVFEWGLEQWFGAWAPGFRWIDMPKVDRANPQPMSKLVE